MENKMHPKEKEILETIEQFTTEIERVNMSIFGDMMGVSQALDELRKGLDKVEHCLDAREFFRASSLGYNEVASAFIFLQRTLGGLQSAADEKDTLIGEICVASGVGVYEEVAPYVKKVMPALQPLTPEQKKKNREAARKMFRQKKKWNDPIPV
jgi:hypothetical protein